MSQLPERAAPTDAEQDNPADAAPTPVGTGPAAVPPAEVDIPSRREGGKRPVPIVRPPHPRHPAFAARPGAVKASIYAWIPGTGQAPPMVLLAETAHVREEAGGEATQWYCEGCNLPTQSAQDGCQCQGIPARPLRPAKPPAPECC